MAWGNHFLEGRSREDGYPKHSESLPPNHWIAEISGDFHFFGCGYRKVLDFVGVLPLGTTVSTIERKLCKAGRCFTTIEAKTSWLNMAKKKKALSRI